MEGWVKIHSKILKWEWYTDTVTKVVFLHCLLRANFDERDWRGIEIERGSFISTIAALAGELSLTPFQVRSALEKLKKTGEITIKTTNKFSIITISNYESYQSVGSKQLQTKRKSNYETPIDNNLNIQSNKAEEQNKEPLSSFINSESVKNPSLYDNDDFQPEKIKTEDDILMERFIEMQNWLKRECPVVCQVKRQLSFDEFKKLMEKYTAKEISKALEKLDEWPNFPKERSTVYRNLVDKLNYMYGQRTTTMG